MTRFVTPLTIALGPDWARHSSRPRSATAGSQFIPTRKDAVQP